MMHLLYSDWYMWILPMVVLWWLFASAMVYVAWNRVVTAVTTAKRMQFGQAMLLIFVGGVLCAPYHGKHYWKGCCKDRVEIQEDTLKLSPGLNEPNN